MAFAFNRRPAPLYETPPFAAPPFSGDPVAAALAPGLGAPLSAPEAFVWGKGGTRMTPAEVAAAREMAQRQMASGADYSPVGHWTQGLARALDGLSGGLEMRRARNADEANRAESDAVVQALIEGDADPAAFKRAILSAMTNPYIDEGAHQLAGMQFKAMQPPKPSEPPEIIQLARIANDPNAAPWERAAAAEAVSRKNDPLVAMTTPEGPIIGRESWVISQLSQLQGGGGQTSGVSQTTAPPAAAINYLRQNPNQAAAFDEKYGAGSAARILGGGVGDNTGGFPDG